MNEIIDNSLPSQSGIDSDNFNSEIIEIINGDTINLSEKDRTNEKIEEILNKIKNPEFIKNINLSYNQLTKIPDRIGDFKKLKKLILTSNPLENKTLPKAIAEIGLEYLEIDNLNENDEYLRNIIPEIKENRIDTFGDEDDDGNRG